jgi:hypothetical protein
MKNISAQDNLKNLFNKFNFNTIEVSVIRNVVLVRFNNSEIQTAKLVEACIVKAGFEDVEIESNNKKDWSMLSFIIPVVA